MLSLLCLLTLGSFVDNSQAYLGLIELAYLGLIGLKCRVYCVFQGLVEVATSSDSSGQTRDFSGEPIFYICTYTMTVVYIHIYIYVGSYIYIYIYIKKKDVYMYTCLYMNTYTHVYLYYTYIYIYIW